MGKPAYRVIGTVWGVSIGILLAGVLTAGLIGCSAGKRITSVSSGRSTIGKTSDPVALPSPVDSLTFLLERDGSSLVLEQTGNKYIIGLSENVVPLDSSARFEPCMTGQNGFEGLAYAVYGFHLPGVDTASLELIWDEAPTDAGMVWAGLSDWNGNRWMWLPVPADYVLNVSHLLQSITEPETGEMLVALAVTGSGCSRLGRIRIGKTTQAGWAMTGHDAQHTYLSPVVGPASSGLAWETTIDDVLKFAPAIGPDGIVYISGEQTVYALMPDGTADWSYVTEYVVTAPAIGSDGRIYFGCGQNLVAVDSNGQYIWSYNTQGNVLSAPVIGADGTVYIGSEDDSVYAFSPGGALIWSYTTGGDVIAPIAIGYDGNLYAGSMDGSLYALTPDGELLWQYDANGALPLAPAIGEDGTIHVVSGDGYLYAVTSTGGTKWKYLTNQDIEDLGNPVVMRDGTVHLPILDFVHIVDNNGVNIGAGMQMSGPRSMIMDSQGNRFYNGINTISKADKTRFHHWSYEVGEDAGCKLALGNDGTLCAICRDGRVLAFKDGNAEEFRITGLTHDPVCGSPGEALTVQALHTGPSLGMTYHWSFSGANQNPGTNSDTQEVLLSAQPGAFSGYVYATNDSGILDTYYFDITVYSPPLVTLVTDKTYGVGQLVAHLDASGTTDIDGEVVSFAWDLNGDDVFGEPGESPYRDVEFNNPGEYKVQVQVTDNDGAVAVNYLYLTVDTVDRGAWPMAGQDQGNRKASPHLGSNQNTRRFAATTSGTLWSAPVIGPKGRIYVGNPDGYVYAYNPNGSRRWIYDSGSSIQSSPAVSTDSNIYLGCLDGKLHALRSDKSIYWLYAAGGPIMGSPVLSADGSLYFGCADHKLYALAESGEFKWSIELDEVISTSPAIGPDGTIYVCDNFPKLHSISPEGTRNWWRVIPDIIIDSPVIGSDGTIFFTTNTHQGCAYNANGTKLWDTASAGINPYTAPAIDRDGNLFYMSSQYIRKASPDGTLLLSYPIGISAVVYSPIVIGADGTIYIGGGDKLMAYDRNGSNLWTYAASGNVAGCPVIAGDGTIVFCSMDGLVNGIGPRILPDD